MLQCSASSGSAEGPEAVGAARAALTLSPEISIGTVPLPEQGNEHDPSIASDGNIFLLVRTDDRSGTTYERIDASTMKILDPDGVNLAQSQNASVAYGGGRFAIVTRVIDGTGSWIRATLLDAAGTVTSSVNLASSTTPNDYPEVVWTGQNFLAIWESGGVHAVRFSAMGTLLDPMPKIPFGTGTGAQSPPRVACGPDNCLVISLNRGNDINEYAILSPTLAASSLVTLSPGQCCMEDVTWDGTRYVLVGDDKSFNLALLYVTPAGTADPLATSLQVPGHTARIDSNGTVSLITSGTTTFILGADGTLIHPSQGLKLFPSTNDPMVQAVGSIPSAYGGGNFLSVWSSTTNPVPSNDSRPDIYGQRTAPDGSPVDADPIRLSQRVNDQKDPAGAFDGANYLLAWTDDRTSIGNTTLSSVYFGRMSSDGTVLDPAGIQLDPQGQNPAVAFGGGNYLIAWEAQFSINAKRVDRDGNIVDASSIAPLTMGGNDPVAVFDGTQFVVGVSSAGVRAQRFGIDGNPIGSAITISSRAVNAGSLTAASDGQGETTFGWLESGGATYRARMKADGTVLDPGGVAICPGCVNETDIAPGLAFGGGEYLVSWARFTSSYDIFAARIAGGTPLDGAGFAITSAAGTQSASRLGYTGYRFLAAWSSGNDIYAGRVTLNGHAADPAGIAISTATVLPNSSSNTQTDMGIVGGNGQALVYYVRVANRSRRLYARIVNDDPACALAGECAADAGADASGSEGGSTGSTIGSSTSNTGATTGNTSSTGMGATSSTTGSAVSSSSTSTGATTGSATASTGGPILDGGSRSEGGTGGTDGGSRSEGGSGGTDGGGAATGATGIAGSTGATGATGSSTASRGSGSTGGAPMAATSAGGASTTGSMPGRSTDAGADAGPTGAAGFAQSGSGCSISSPTRRPATSVVWDFVGAVGILSRRRRASRTARRNGRRASDLGNGAHSDVATSLKYWRPLPPA